jgi:hypothetical protein
MSVFVPQSASGQSQLQDDAARPPVIRGPTSRTVNPTLPLNAEPMEAMATPKIWDSFKHKADTAGSDEGSEVGIQG